MIDNLEALKQKLAPLLSEKRYQHSLRVSKTAQELAHHWQLADDTIVVIAGLLHDCAKELNPEKVQALGCTEQESFVKIFNEYPKVWHAFVSPCVIRVHFLITHIPILTAAKWHTTGHREMDIDDQIVYVADYIEPERNYSNVPFIRELAYTNLDWATYAMAYSTQLKLKKKNAVLHPFTEECLAYYEQKCPEQVRTEIQKIISQIDQNERTTPL